MCGMAHAETEHGTLSADDQIVGVKSYGFVDLEGAKVSAIIVEYAVPVDGTSLEPDSFTITDYTILQEQSQGFEAAIEMDYDGIPGNEGQIEKVYVNNQPEPSAEGGTDSGLYVIIEVNTDYMLNGQNLVYTSSMIAGATQVKPIRTVDGKTIDVGTHEIGNYSESEQTGGMGGQSNRSGTESDGQTQKRQGGGRTGNGMGGAQGGGTRTARSADRDKIILPEFGEGSGWTLNYIGDGAFKATNCYSEYTGQYEDFELPYSIYVPSQEVLDSNIGKVSLVIHMEHAGSNDSDPMAAITSSRAAVRLASAEIQSENPAIIVVPQVEESRRSTDDMVASSEVNTAAWELLDELLVIYADYIDVNRIYGTGQSMGGMTVLNMASQRDNFFAGIAVVGAQWSNNYNKDYQHNGSPARTPENDPISFSGSSVDPAHFANWYYMISDDNILVQTCAEDEMATGEWRYARDYLENAGGTVSFAEWDPWLDVSEQNALGTALVDHESAAPGTGISWVLFTRGSHMSTWKYGYRLDFAFEWLFSQRRETENTRGKLEQLTGPWLGRDESGALLPGSGTEGMNSAQFTTGGASEVYGENWTPESVGNAIP
ncbi:MAG: prolyl oligopeptidase family serine peptidase [Clostridia bacterium]|nr:prolyl oligopeptidase family serine peptidase [Clostridia bacterium]